MFPVCVCASVFVQPHPEFQVQTSQPDVLLAAEALHRVVCSLRAQIRLTRLRSRNYTEPCVMGRGL